MVVAPTLLERRGRNNHVVSPGRPTRLHALASPDRGGHGVARRGQRALPVRVVPAGRVVEEVEVDDQRVRPAARGRRPWPCPAGTGRRRSWCRRPCRPAPARTARPRTARSHHTSRLAPTGAGQLDPADQPQRGRVAAVGGQGQARRLRPRAQRAARSAAPGHRASTARRCARSGSPGSSGLCGCLRISSSRPAPPAGVSPLRVGVGADAPRKARPPGAASRPGPVRR